MGDSGIFRAPSLQPWQRESISRRPHSLASTSAATRRATCARAVHDSLLEVLDPVRCKVRLQKEITAAWRQAALTIKAERRAADRRSAARRKVNLGPRPGVPDRRKGERGRGTDRRTKR